MRPEAAPTGPAGPTPRAYAAASALRRPSRAAALLAFVGVLACAGSAAAAEHRFAVVIGADRGASDEAPLRFAERDAARVARVLQGLGDVPRQRTVLLRGARRSAVIAGFADVRRRIARLRQRDPSARVLLLVFFSGHASVRAIHLDGTELAFSELRAQGRQAGADVSVFFVDACRSGGLTRVKGAVPAQPFRIQATDHLSSHGTAIISSAALGEDAQESDRLSGGIFTHHLVAGLRGAADTSRDGRVTLDEVYRYAFSQTVRTTSRTRFVQHPTYAFRIKGRHAVVLTRLAAQRSLGRVRLRQAGSWMLARQDGEGVTELTARAGLQLVLPRGRYLVRRRERAGVREGTIVVGAGTTDIDEGQLTLVPYGSTVRRGGGAGLALRVGTGVEATTAPLAGLAPGLHAAIGAQIDLSGISLQARLRYGVSGADNATLSLSQDMIGGDVTGLRAFDFGAWAFGLGLRGGGEWWSQRFTAQAESTRGQWVWRLGPLARLTWSPLARLAVSGECTLNIHGLTVEGEGWTTRSVPACGIALAWYVR